MPAGVLPIPRPGAVNLVDDVIDQAARTHELGVKQVWLAQQLSFYEAIPSYRKSSPEKASTISSTWPLWGQRKLLYASYIRTWTPVPPS
jgi:hypothetical protein